MYDVMKAKERRTRGVGMFDGADRDEISKLKTHCLRSFFVIGSGCLCASHLTTWLKVLGIEFLFNLGCDFYTWMLFPRLLRSTTTFQSIAVARTRQIARQISGSATTMGEKKADIVTAYSVCIEYSYNKRQVAFFSKSR
jgi:hypothetical protein